MYLGTVALPTIFGSTVVFEGEAVTDIWENSSRGKVQ